MRTIMNLSSMKFGFLTAIEYSGRSGSNKPLWKCLCECGSIKIVSSQSLTSGTTKSCGCKKRAFLIKYTTKHGLSKTPEYGIWCAMISRCSCVNNDAYENYGGRGITICKQWKSFSQFIHDMGPRPSTQHTIERKNNNQGYTPENCIWATRDVQLRNTRRNKQISYMGKTQCLSAWAKEFGIKVSLFRHRLERGWDIKTALSEPIHPIYATNTYNPKHLFTINGETRCLAEWARQYNMKRTTLSSRLKRGIDIIAALETPVQQRNR